VCRGVVLGDASGYVGRRARVCGAGVGLDRIFKQKIKKEEDLACWRVGSMLEGGVQVSGSI